VVILLEIQLSRRDPISFSRHPTTPGVFWCTINIHLTEWTEYFLHIVAVFGGTIFIAFTS
jgi:hypothetical protein